MVKCQQCNSQLSQPHERCLRCERQDAELEKEVLMPYRLQKELERLVGIAQVTGLVVTITQKPKLPLAMGNYETVVEVRDANSIYRNRK